jgi:hypothetical protein
MTIAGRGFCYLDVGFIGADGGRLILNNFQVSFLAHAGPLNTAVVAKAVVVEQVENGRLYAIHFYLGKY